MKNKVVCISAVAASVLSFAVLTACTDKRSPQPKLEIAAVTQDIYGSVFVEFAPADGGYTDNVNVSWDGGNTWTYASRRDEGNSYAIGTLEQLQLCDGGKITLLAKLVETDEKTAGEISEPFTATLKGVWEDARTELLYMPFKTDSDSESTSDAVQTHWAFCADGDSAFLKRAVCSNYGDGEYIVDYNDPPADMEFEYKPIEFKDTYVIDAANMMQRNTDLEIQADKSDPSSWTAYDKNVGFEYKNMTEAVKTYDENDVLLYTDYRICFILRICGNETRLQSRSLICDVIIHTEVV